jgi:hypothetical protein
MLVTFLVFASMAFVFLMVALLYFMPVSKTCHSGCINAFKNLLKIYDIQNKTVESVIPNF